MGYLLSEITNYSLGQSKKALERQAKEVDFILEANVRTVEDFQQGDKGLISFMENAYMLGGWYWGKKSTDHQNNHARQVSHCKIRE